MTNEFMKNLLVTAEPDDAVSVIRELSGSPLKAVHVPLEQYIYSRDPGQDIVGHLDTWKFVAYGGLRNARHFLSWVEETGTLDEFRTKIHLVLNEPERDLLDEAGIPAIMPKENAAPIDLLEFLLRISMDGAVLYPCPEESSEEIPALLNELQMPVTEFTVCRSLPLNTQDVELKRKQLREQEPDSILFHSRGSVVRTRVAFPEMDLTSKTLIAASEGVAQRLRKEGLEVEATADGSWKSVLDLLRSYTG